MRSEDAFDLQYDPPQTEDPAQPSQVIQKPSQCSPSHCTVMAQAKPLRPGSAPVGSPAQGNADTRVCNSHSLVMQRIDGQRVRRLVMIRMDGVTVGRHAD